jgi:hypothetical protein
VAKEYSWKQCTSPAQNFKQLCPEPKLSAGLSPWRYVEQANVLKELYVASLTGGQACDTPLNSAVVFSRRFTPSWIAIR